MKNIIASLLAALFLLAAIGGTGGASDPVDPGVPGSAVSPVYIESTGILYLESYPVQVVLVVRGTVPTPCHEIDSSVQVLDDRVDVRAWSMADPDQTCTQVLEPFEVSIPLGAFESASLPVFVNGDEIGRIEIGTAPTRADLSLHGAGWSYGMCLGYCLADLEINDDNVLATGRSRMDEQPLYRNAGTLTPLGREQLDTAIGALAGAPLDAVYGCPDCADGGAAYLVLAEGTSVSRVEMQADQPPDFLTGTYGMATSLIEALAACASDDLLIVNDDCVPYQGT
jgi:hypothetical protein